MEVLLLAAMTSDGFISQVKSQNPTHWTSNADKRWFSQKSKEIGLCVMGRPTYQIIGRALPERSTIILTSQPTLFEKEIIPALDQIEGTIPELVTSSLKPEELIADLVRREYEAVAICGGARVYTEFMLAGVVTKLFLTIEPVFFGQGIGLFSQALNVNLRLLETHHLSDQTIVQELAVVQ